MSTTDATTVSRTAASALASARVVSFTAHKETVLHVFTGADGAMPSGDLITDEGGALYGTTAGGGGGVCPPNGCGAVFKLTPPAFGYTAWTESVLYAFDLPGQGQTAPTRAAL